MELETKSERGNRLGHALGHIGRRATFALCNRPFRAVGSVALVASVVLTWHVSQVEHKLMQGAAMETATRYAAALDEFRTFYETRVVPAASNAGVEVAPSHEVDGESIPVPAVLASHLGNRIADRDAGGQIRIYSPHAFSWNEGDGAFQDEFAFLAWRHVSRHPDEPFWRYESVGGRPSLRFATADVVRGACTSCPDRVSPNGKQWKTGDVRGVVEVITPLKTGVVLARSGAWDTFTLLLILTTIGVLFLSLMIRALKSAADHAQQLAEQRRKANEKLESEVEQRSAAEASLEVANERLNTNHVTLERWASELELAHSRLREVDELKTKFLSEVSHELRSPMSAIVSAAKIITKHHATKPEVVDRFGNTIVSEGARMTRLINDFLDLTKVESGCVDWNDEEIDATALVNDALHGLDSLAVEGGITLEADVDADLPTLRVDRDRLFQVLTNLANNAIKFTPDGGKITIRATRQDDQFLFAVVDTGPGIPEEELAKVFDRFHQVRNKTPDGKQRRGTGLGLCISREIVEHYGGRIWVESKLGEGSRFMFTISSAAADAGNGAQSAASSEVETVQTVRVALLLDDREQAERAMSMTDASGIECRVCDDLDVLLDLATTWRPDVCVLSASIVHGAGDELLERVQGHGVSKILVHSPEHGLTAPSVLDSSELLIPTLRGITPAGASVLVAEDDEKYRSILEFELKQAGYEVVPVDSGSEALERVRQQPPDAMVLDLIMPGVDGLSVLERLAEDGIELPIFVYTAMDDPSVALAAKELGATEVFRKDSSGHTTYTAVAARVRRVLTPILADAACGTSTPAPRRSELTF